MDSNLKCVHFSPCFPPVSPLRRYPPGLPASLSRRHDPETNIERLRYDGRSAAAAAAAGGATRATRLAVGANGANGANVANGAGSEGGARDVPSSVSSSGADDCPLPTPTPLRIQQLCDFRAEINCVLGENGPHTQGVISMADNEEADGGTILVPRFHQCFTEWQKALGR